MNQQTNEVRPRLMIARSVLQKIMYFVNNCPNEISGMGQCQYLPDLNAFYVIDVHVLEQEVGPGSTDIDPAALGKLEARHLIDKMPGQLNFWWHSHVNMSVFWSGTDLDTINNIGKQGYCLATVFNKRGEMRTALALKAEGQLNGMPLLLDNLETIVYDPELSDEVVAQWKKDLETKVKTKVYTNVVSPKQLGLGGTVSTKAILDGKSVITGTGQSATRRGLGLDTGAWKVPKWKAFKTYLRANEDIIKQFGILSKAEKETIVMGSICRLDPMAMEVRYMDFTIQEWDKIDDLLERTNAMLAFNEFDWDKLEEYTK